MSRIFALAACALAVSALKEDKSFGTAADGFQASVHAYIDEAPTYGVDAGASLTVGLPTPACNTENPRCKSFMEQRKVQLLEGGDQAADFLAEISFDTAFTAKTQQCNIMNMEMDFSATLNVALATKTGCTSCVGHVGLTACANVVQCVYDSAKAAGTKGLDDLCYTFDGKQGLDSSGGCNTFKIPAMPTKTYKVDFS